ncbi:MAG: hypothetical protein FLDDKLPJ_03409 [Phycisphaerae bacterium]|nr:hypothetical protein [Phycisphaerae bacterium]
MKERIWSLVSELVWRMRRGPCLAVLTLHRVGPNQPIRPDAVARMFAYLRRHFRMMLPSQWTEALSEPSAMITIDDGHEDAHEIIYPLARREGVPLVICVPTDYFLRDRWLWFDRLNWAIAQCAGKAQVRVGGETFSPDHRPSVVAFKMHVKSLPPADRDGIVAELLGIVGREPPTVMPKEYRPVPREAMRGMLATGTVELCAHSVTHPVMTRLDDAALREELTRGRAELEAFSGRPVVAFCYPHGQSGTFDDRTQAAVAQAGYRVAFTSVPGVNRPGSTDPLRLKRVHVHPRLSMLTRELAGLGGWRRRRAGAE